MMTYKTILSDAHESLPLGQPYNLIKGEWLVRWTGARGGELIETVIDGGKPTLERIKELVLGWHNAEIDETILRGYRFEGHLVWLSEENQNNYFRAFVMAMLTNGATLPVTFKLGTDAEPVLREFRTLEDLQGFILGAFAHVGETLTAGWERKMAIDWGAYEQALQAYE